MSCNLYEIRRQLEDMQNIMDRYNYCHHDDDKTTDEIHAMIAEVKKAIIQAVQDSDKDVMTVKQVIEIIQNVE